MRKLYLIAAILFLITSCEDTIKENRLEGIAKTLEITEIKSISATVKGSLQITKKEGNSYSRENGFCYSISHNPTINDFKVVGERITNNGNITITTKNPKDGEFTANLESLQKNTAYFVRSYSSNKFEDNNSAVFYGNELSFTTLLTEPEPLSPYFIIDGIMIDDKDNVIYGNWEKAKISCENSVSGGYENWRLPTITELAKIYGKKDEIGGFNTNSSISSGYPYYWSSTLNSTNYYSVINFYTGQQGELSFNYGDYDNKTYCRCVRDTAKTEEPPLPDNIVVDVDGNRYNTVVIGGRTWMVENLKTTKYNDGKDIENANNTSGGGLNTYIWNYKYSNGCYVWYNGDINNKTPYGALYNYYAVETNKLCPTGWHVPTQQEWANLASSFGGKDIAGGKLKETGFAHWLAPNTGADNASGFTALPGGSLFENNSGSFVFGLIGQHGYWWTSSKKDSYTPYAAVLINDDAGIIVDFEDDRQSGNSCRCIKNE